MSKRFPPNAKPMGCKSCTGWASLMATANGVIGCGVGLLLAGKLGRPAQRITAAALLAVGAVATVPFFYGVLAKQINRPESKRGMMRRLDSIRGGQGSGFGEDTEIY